MTHTPTRILVPTDFSPASDRAVSLAKELADRFDAELHLLHVRIVVDEPTLDTAILDEVEQILAVSESRTRRALERTVENGRTRYHAHIKRGNVPADVIVDAVSEYDCDLVIMGTHGHRGFKNFLVGSVAKKVVYRSPVPVLTTRAETTGTMPPRKILVAHDSSDESVHGVRVAAAWARRLQADITLLHVVELLTYPSFYGDFMVRDDYSERVIGRCHRALDQIAEEHLGGIPHETAVIHAHAAPGIAKYAEENDFDLVVLATHGLSGITRALLGSVAERVTQLSEVPVLTVREQSSKPPE